MRLFVLAWLLGHLALQHAARLPEFPLGLAGLAALPAAGLVRGPPRAALLVSAGLLLGHGHAAWRAEVRLAEALPRTLEGEDLPVVGVIAGLPQPTDRGVRFLFHVEQAGGLPVPRTVSLSWYAERSAGEAGAILPPALAAGQRWRFTVRLKRARGLSNPHAFDFEPWALERGIRATGYVRARAGHELLEARVDGWPYTVHRWRGEIRGAMLSTLAESRLRGVVVALAIGDQDAISAEDWEVFWRTGVGHLASISGLHITMLAGLAGLALRWAWVRIPALALRYPARKAAVIAAVAAAFAYSLMAGYQVPAQRTVVMLAVVALCVIADRHASPSRVLALAAFAVVAVDPWAVRSGGFWLSFGAVGAIFYAMALRTGHPGRWRAILLEQLAVTLVMLPLLVALFQEVSLVSPLANAAAIPVVSLLVVPLAIAGAFLGLAWPLHAAHALLEALMGPLEWLAALPSTVLESHAPAPWTVAAALLGCLWLLAPRGFPLRSCGALWIVPLFAIAPARPAPGEAWADVLDVGNGLAVVVRTHAHALVYDAGPAWNSDIDSGNRIVVPFLRGEGVPRIDGLVVTHADDDHSGGAASVALSRSPAWLLSPLIPQDPLHGMAGATLRCHAGQRWSWDGVAFAVLHPPPAAHEPGDKRKENDRGCVLRVATRGASLLLAADAEARSEAEMVARDARALAADVLLVPHHGSKTSSTPRFLDAVRPRVGILSVGHRNRFGHPHAAVVQRYRERGIELRRTDEEGALRVTLPAGAEAPRVTGRPSACRYWSERPSCGSAGATPR